MLPVPQINFQRTPFTLILVAAAFALELVSTLDPAQRNFYYNDLKLGIWLQIWMGEVWRPFTTTLLHGNLIHALFNIYWVLRFGTAIENRLGSFRTLLLVVLLGYVSSLAQYVFTFGEPRGMVGLSGIVYGLFGIVLIGRRYVSEYAWVCDEATIRILLFWFVLSILLTNAGVMAIGNVAHGAGLVFGVLYGLTIYHAPQRWAWGALSSIATVLMLATLVTAPWHQHYRVVAGHRAHLRQPQVPIVIQLKDADDPPADVLEPADTDEPGPLSDPQ